MPFPNKSSLAPCAPETTPDSTKTVCQPVLANTLVCSYSPPQAFSGLVGPTPPGPQVDSPTVPQNTSQKIGMKVMMIKTVSSQITVLQLDYTPLWIYGIPKVLKATLPMTLANRLVAEGQVGILKLKVLLSNIL